MREADSNETSGELGSAFGGTLVGLSQLSIPWLDPLIESSILFPLVSVDLEYHDRHDTKLIFPTSTSLQPALVLSQRHPRRSFFLK